MSCLGKEIEERAMIKCDWCPKQLRAAPVKGNARRRFCSQECKKAHEDFQQRIYDPVRTRPYVPQENADV